MKHEFRVGSVVRIGWVVVLLALAGGVSRARANTAVVVPPSADMTLPVDTLEVAASELMRLIKVHGFDVVSPGQASVAAEDAQQSGNFPASLNVLDCRSIECALEYRRLFDASFAAQLLLSGLSGKVRTVVVTITEGAEASFAGTAQVQGGDLKGAVRAAYSNARDKYVRGDGPWLTIAGGPDGALVLVDGQEYGTLPIERRFIGGGAHKVEVRAQGYATQTFDLDVPVRGDHEQRLDVSLLALNVERREPKLDRTWDYVLGGLMIVAGGVHLGFGVYQLTEQGECAEWVGDRCKLRYGDESGVSQENLLIGLGAAGVALGGAWMGVAPIARLKLRADKQAASLSVQGTF